MLLEKKFEVNEIAQVGDVIAVIEVEGNDDSSSEKEEFIIPQPVIEVESTPEENPVEIIEAEVSLNPRNDSSFIDFI